MRDQVIAVNAATHPDRETRLQVSVLEVLKGVSTLSVGGSALLKNGHASDTLQGQADKQLASLPDTLNPSGALYMRDILDRPICEHRSYSFGPLCKSKHQCHVANARCAGQT